MFNSEFSGDANFSLLLFTMIIYSMVKYINKIDHFANNDGKRSNGFELSYNTTIQGLISKFNFQNIDH